MVALRARMDQYIIKKDLSLKPL